MKKLNPIQINYSDLKTHYETYSEKLYGKPLGQLDANQLNNVICAVIKSEIITESFDLAKSYYSEKRIAIYFSIEYLIGRIVLDMLVNTGIKKMTTKIFEEAGVDINILEEVDDTALGNGGLGRLAACFIESAATTGYPLFGYGIYYKYGLFKQQFENNQQIEVPDDWTQFGDQWFEPCKDDSVIVKYEDTAVKAVPYILPIVGYNPDRKAFKQNVFPLTLWKSEPIEGTNESATKISDCLYPEDSTDEGKKLRLRQEYFFVSATLQRLIKIHLEKHGTLKNFEDYYCFQMNDTHPVLACVEFIRLLKENGYTFSEASAKAKKCFAYTNHTIMAEALEKWDILIFKDMLPDCFKVIEELNQELIDFLIGKPEFTICNFENGELKSDPDWKKVKEYELFSKGKIYMSNIACYVGFAVNGVAEVHSNIIKEETLNKWFKVYPEKFTNCTNGVTPRRWLKLCNPYLASFFDGKVGKKWTTYLPILEKLEPFKNDSKTLAEFAKCKKQAKAELAKYILKKEGIEIDPNSIFDCQVKRIHEYKRQLMNALRILYIYYGLKNGTIKNFYNTTFIIGGKAAPGYKLAKEIITLIKNIQDLVNNDPEMNGKMKVVFLTNFNVSYGEKVYAGANFSEQISTAGTEASGTSNMKFMMNGAPTIGTADGANIEIVEEAGTKNNYIFGASVSDLKGMQPFYNQDMFLAKNPELKDLLSYLKKEPLKNWDLANTLEYIDKYFVMFDLKSYIDITLKANFDYAEEQRTGDYSYYTRKGFKNAIHSGKFSSDRTIQDYATRIWKIETIKNI